MDLLRLVFFLSSLACGVRAQDRSAPRDVADLHGFTRSCTWGNESLLRFIGPWIETRCWTGDDRDCASGDPNICQGTYYRTQINLSYCLGVGPYGDMRPEKYGWFWNVCGICSIQDGTTLLTCWCTEPEEGEDVETVIDLSTVVDVKDQTLTCHDIMGVRWDA